MYEFLLFVRLQFRFGASSAAIGMVRWSEIEIAVCLQEQHLPAHFERLKIIDSASGYYEGEFNRKPAN